MTNCHRVQERMSEYLDGLSPRDERLEVRGHLADCSECRAVAEGMQEVIRWGREFPQFSPPEGLSGRIMARTPRPKPYRVQKETWSDTLAALAGWVRQGRAVAATCASVLCLVWLVSAVRFAPVQPDLEVPMAMYYRIDRMFGRAYDQAVRLYYRAPIVTEIQARIDQIRENSG